MNWKLGLIAFALAASFAAERPEWDNTAILQVGTEKPHASMMVYPTAEQAKTGDRIRFRQVALEEAHRALKVEKEKTQRIMRSIAR